MTQPRILSSVEIEFQGQSQARELIERAGFAIEVRHPQPGWLDEETRAKLDGFDALLAGGENLNAATMDQADTPQDHRPQRRRLRQGGPRLLHPARHRRHQHPRCHGRRSGRPDLRFAPRDGALAQVRRPPGQDGRHLRRSRRRRPLRHDLGAGRLWPHRCRGRAPRSWLQDASSRSRSLDRRRANPRPRCRACRPRHSPVPSRRRYLAPTADRGKTTNSSMPNSSAL